MKRRSMKSVADEIRRDEMLTKCSMQNARRNPYSDNRMHFCTYDLFKKICLLTGCSKKESYQMEKKLRSRIDLYDSNISIEKKQSVMYETLISHPICAKVCEKQKYHSWQDLVNRFVL